jgi:hypothetical protein
MLKISSNKKNKNLFLFAVLLLCSAQKVAAQDGRDVNPQDSIEDENEQGWLSFFPMMNRYFRQDGNAATSAGGTLYNAASNVGKGIGDSAVWFKENTWDNLPSSNSLRESADNLRKGIDASAEWVKDAATSAGGTLYNAASNVGKGIGDSAVWVKDGAVSAGSALYNSAGNLGQGIADSAEWVKGKTWDKMPSWSSFYGGAQQGANDGKLVELAQRNIGLTEEEKNSLKKVLAKGGRGNISDSRRAEILNTVKKIAEARGINTNNLGEKIDELRDYVNKNLGHLLG